jgi:hypothetical protein
LRLCARYSDFSCGRAALRCGEYCFTVNPEEPKVFAACANFSGGRFAKIRHSTKEFNTTKVAKDTKIEQRGGHRISKKMVSFFVLLRALRGDIRSFGCGSAAPGLSWLDPFPLFRCGFAAPEASW